MKLLLLVAFALLFAVAFAARAHPKLPETHDEIKEAFGSFVRQYGKIYSAEEHNLRFNVFKENIDRIKSLNARHTRAAFGINKFSDLTPQEFSRHYLNSKTATEVEGPIAPLVSDDVISALPDNFDWRTKGAVTPVKNQGQCGSCWAFSTTGNVEGQWFLAGHTLTGLSEQNLVDCDHECTQYDGQRSCDDGCDGGLQPNAYHYIISNKGIDTESSYPYQGVDGNCAYNAANKGAQISNWTFVSKDENQMAAYLVEHGPLAIAADAVEWQFYLWGVFEGPCGTQLDHGILIVGYGEEIDELGFNIQYWIVKNSWGSDWGLDGYLWIIRGVGECGLNTYVTSSIV